MVRCVGLALVLVLASGCCETGGTPEMPPEERCRMFLHGLGTAMLRYEREHGSLPASVLRDGSRQTYSWRLALVPFMDLEPSSERPLASFRFDEAWDSVRNSRWADEQVLYRVHFQCSAEAKDASYEFTSYLMLVGKNGEPLHGTKAVIVIESAHCGVKWLEPRDCVEETLWTGDSPFGPGRLNSDHPRVVHALRADGKVIEIPKNSTTAAVKRFLHGDD